jgi:hypothetical protein
MPDPVRIDLIEEPFIRAQIITKPEYIGNIMTLCLGKRGNLINQSYLTTTRVELLFEMPLTEIVFDFYDKLKSQTRGYASFDYHPIGMREADIVKMDILLNNEKVDALSALIHRSRAQDFGRKALRKIERSLSPGNSSRSPSRLPLAPRSLPAKIFLHFVKMLLQNVTVVISVVNVSFLKSRKKVRNACAKSVPSKYHKKHFWRCSSLIEE